MKPWIKKIALPVTLFLALVLLTNFSSNKTNETLCSDIKVKITAINDETKFISEEDVLTKIKSIAGNIKGQPIESLNIENLEKGLFQLPHTEKAKVYKNMYGELMVNIHQKEAIARIMMPNGRGFYLDKQGCYIPLSKNHAALTLVFTGSIPKAGLGQCNVDILNNKELADESLMDDIYQLANYIHENSFWRAQIQQIHVDENFEFQLIPRVGSHIIELGKVYHLEEKLKKLKIFYTQGLPYNGWNKYSKINLKFKDQVVCTKK